MTTLEVVPLQIVVAIMTLVTLRVRAHIQCEARIPVRWLRRFLNCHTWLAESISSLFRSGDPFGGLFGCSLVLPLLGAQAAAIA